MAELALCALRAVGIRNLSVNDNLRDAALVAAVINLSEAAAAQELHWGWVGFAVGRVDASAAERVALSGALAVLLLSGVGWAGKNRPLSVHLVLVSTALEGTENVVALAESLRELELADNAIVGASARAVPSLSLGSSIHGIVNATTGLVLERSRA